VGGPVGEDGSVWRLLFAGHGEKNRIQIQTKTLFQLRDALEKIDIIGACQILIRFFPVWSRRTKRVGSCLLSGLE
jgi:hypothetical protein